jgi:hypothetical protein
VVKAPPFLAPTTNEPTPDALTLDELISLAASASAADVTPLFEAADAQRARIQMEVETHLRVRYEEDEAMEAAQWERERRKRQAKAQRTFNRRCARKAQAEAALGATALGATADDESSSAGMPDIDFDAADDCDGTSQLFPSLWDPTLTPPTLRSSLSCSASSLA